MEFIVSQIRSLNFSFVKQSSQNFCNSRLYLQYWCKNYSVHLFTYLLLLSEGCMFMGWNTTRGIKSSSLRFYTIILSFCIKKSECQQLSSFAEPAETKLPNALGLNTI